MCDPSPTKTQYATIVSTNVLTTFSLQLLTVPGAATTVPVPTCVSIDGDACAGTTTVSAPTSGPDTVKTLTVPLLITELDTEVTPTLTLFAPCPLTTSSDPLSVTSSTSTNRPVGGGSPLPAPVTPPVTPTATSSPASASSTAARSTSMAIDSVTSAIGTALQGGSTIILYTTIVTSHPVTAPTGSDASGSHTSPGSQNNNLSRSSSPVAAIAGGTVGGFVGLLALVGLVACVVQRFRKKADAMWAEDEANEKPAYHRRQSRPVFISPQPYQYGIVGTAATPPLTPPATSIGHSSALLLSRSASVTMDAMADGIHTHPHSHPTSPTPSTPMSRGGSPQQPITPGGYHFDREFGARPMSAVSQHSAPPSPWRERRTSRSSVAALSVHLPPSPPTNDYFGMFLGTTEPTPTLTPPAADSTSQLSSEPRRSLHVVN